MQVLIFSMSLPEISFVCFIWHFFISMLIALLCSLSTFVKHTCKHISETVIANRVSSPLSKQSNSVLQETRSSHFCGHRELPFNSKGYVQWQDTNCFASHLCCFWIFLCPERGFCAPVVKWDDKCETVFAQHEPMRGAFSENICSDQGQMNQDFQEMRKAVASIFFLQHFSSRDQGKKHKHVPSWFMQSFIFLASQGCWWWQLKSTLLDSNFVFSWLLRIVKVLELAGFVWMRQNIWVEYYLNCAGFWTRQSELRGNANATKLATSTNNYELEFLVCRL